MTSMLLIGGATPIMMKEFTKNFTVHIWDDIDNKDAFLAKYGAEIAAVATNGHDGVSPEIMAGLDNLKIISCYGVGYDAIDTKIANARDIMVTHTPIVLNNDVANTAIMLMLAVSRRLVHDHEWVCSGRWKEQGNAPLTRSIEGTKVGIFGLGRIGQTIARKLAAFDCDIAYHTRTERPNLPYRFYDNLAKMAADVDYLIAITPGDASTHKKVNRAVIDALGSEGVFINVGRGSVVDEEALVAALEDGSLGGAGLDVFANEPNVPPALFGMDNVTLTPHVASATVETRRAMGDLTIENLLRFFNDGKVTTPVPECAHMKAAQ
ncbi:2-hydroxyacid dehydrogenase [Candidatus Puniceispirillum sp.]|jgi:lactate dehydrogenase-like 2-hydroxyacid dehydrogenase|uniref:2-hydroxyacid dehydrogenase n=1 Tax=Candidatus Puniceispirillum sp. TaxID=2026719 RepID=UPI001ED48ED6|nr:2-hydroxyacid dehydrogenase [Candidatus Puniceispirillum sp.]MBT6566507.1 2-hydroxyacid dehydrogenase [Candidatus Puniceispirillum sp.]